MSDFGGAILLLGRGLIAIYLIAIAGAFHFSKGAMAIGFERQSGFPFATLAGWPTGVWLAGAGVSIGLGIWADIGALMFAAFVIPAAVWFHRFWAIEDESQKQTQTLLFWRNVTFLGASLALFAFFAAFGHDLPFTITDPAFDLRK